MPRIAVEDLLVHLSQPRSWICSQLLDEPFAHLSKGLQRVGLSAATELGKHQLPGQSFVERMFRRQRGKRR